MSKLAQEYQAINLSQGFPNFMPDEYLLSLSKKALDSMRNQYAPMSGLPELRQKLAEKIFNLHQYKYDWEEEITITAGATQAILTAISTIVKPKDEVVVFAPAYDCYQPTIEQFGGIVKNVQQKSSKL